MRTKYGISSSRFERRVLQASSSRGDGGRPSALLEFLNRRQVQHFSDQGLLEVESGTKDTTVRPTEAGLRVIDAILPEILPPSST
ncbi:hypothetical protein EV182_000256 [Spiromyces aspiralis]|uniref:Uncharacterized protein n=1 Tax=Spiromyces aspiralis TaxID=68401 RepID=A0ACC1HUR1_9FUNG|nr:hypothetical protein EV182_000256 [Spiromyces aspiralis]